MSGPTFYREADAQRERDLLTRAAKAAGIEIVSIDCRVPPASALIPMGGDRRMPIRWSPLTDDADAFRLARSLGMGVAWMKVYVAGSNPMIEVAIEDTGDMASVRRAIVECAAELGSR